MTTKTKKTTIKRGRPTKDFSSINITKNRSKARGRPKKIPRVEESVNSKIIDHGRDINQLSRTNENIHLDIKNSTFTSKKLDSKTNKKSDNFALGLLIFSMVLFIFSLYKTFYLNRAIELHNYNKIYQTNIKENDIMDNLVDNNNNQFVSTEKNELIEEENIDIIRNFYNQINLQNFDEIGNLVDTHLKSSNVFRTYFNKIWLSKFIENTINKKLYITNFVKIEENDLKLGTQKYGFTIKYKLNNNNELFKEDREIAIVTRGDKNLIGSIRCVTTGCSRMPFFNPQKYGIK